VRQGNAHFHTSRHGSFTGVEGVEYGFAQVGREVFGFNEAIHKFSDGGIFCGRFQIGFDDSAVQDFAQEHVTDLPLDAERQ